MRLEQAFNTLHFKTSMERRQLLFFLKVALWLCLYTKFSFKATKSRLNIFFECRFVWFKSTFQKWTKKIVCFSNFSPTFCIDRIQVLELLFSEFPTNCINSTENRIQINMCIFINTFLSNDIIMLKFHSFDEKNVNKNKTLHTERGWYTYNQPINV